MTLSLSLQAAAVYALALLLSHLGVAATKRAILIAACIAVAVLPLLGFAPSWEAEAPGSTAVQGVLEALQEPASVGAAAGLDRAPWRPQTMSILPWIWAAGVAMTGGRLAVSVLRAHSLRASASRRDGDVAISDRVDVPVVVGVLHPLILLPPSSSAWTVARTALVLAHERAHVRGRDNLWLLLAQILACVHWFDPLAWWTVASLRNACEHNADNTVLDGGASPTDYADTLIALARRRTPAQALAMARMSGLEQRVRAVLSGRSRSAGRASRALGIGIVAVLAVGTATATPALPTDTPLTTDIDAVLEAEADRLIALWQPEGVVLIALDARTGALRGQAVRGDLARPVGLGSVTKPFTVVAALEAGVPPAYAFDDGDMASILERSSNVGAAQIGAHIGRTALDSVHERVGIPAQAQLPLEQLAIGGAIATPMQIAIAWTHLAGHGAIESQIAATTREMLVQAVQGENATGRRAAVPGMRVAGKTGTAPLLRADGTVDPERYLASFVGLAPADDPELVLLVAVAGPRGDTVWGGVVAAPSFRRIIEAAL